MLGDIYYSNPTKLYFGENALDNLKNELKNYGKNIQLIYGKSSIKKIGLYDEIIKILKDCGKNVFEDSGVMPNPTYDKVKEGVQIARENNVDFLLAVGGGSVIDYAKAVAVAVKCSDDAWDKYFVRMEEVDNEILPIGAVLTMVGTGSEMNGGSVITNTESNLKIARVFGEENYPKFAILNPVLTYSVPKYQMIAGFFDIMSHIMEQYFSDFDDNTTDYICEGLMKSLINSSRIAVHNPTDYEARSNIMWTSTWALNTLIEKGKTQDWMVHMIGHSISAITDATHGMTLASVSIPYYKLIMPYGLSKFKRFAVNVWGVNERGKTDEEIAREGLVELEKWMNEIGLVLNSKELGVNDENIDDIVKGIFVCDSGYKKLTEEEIYQVLRESMEY